MEYRRLGKSGLRVSELSLGSWVTFKNQVDLALAEKLLSTAYEAGINFFDNAEAYAQGDSEKIMGQALKKLGWERDTYCVSSKVFWGGQKPTQRGLNAKHVTEACHQALRRMQVDYLDLYFCHRPDLHTPIEETVRAMDNLVRQGKVLYWGTSEWTAEQIMEAHAVAAAHHLTPPTMEQPQYNMFEREKVEREFSRLYETVGLGTTIWSPLASGVLTGKYKDGIPEDSRMMLPGFDWLKTEINSERGQEKVKKACELEKLAKGIGITLTQLALAWCLKNPNVSTVILGASKAHQLEENLKALDALSVLDSEVMVEVEKILGNRPPEAMDYL